jgi:hypothetical protein
MEFVIGVALAGTNPRQDPLHARHVPRTQARTAQRVVPSLDADAIVGIQDPTAASARLVPLENTKPSQAQTLAAIAERARTRHQLAHRLHRPASRVPCSPALLALDALL